MLKPVLLLLAATLPDHGCGFTLTLALSPSRERKFTIKVACPRHWSKQLTRRSTSYIGYHALVLHNNR